MILIYSIIIYSIFYDDKDKKYNKKQCARKKNIIEIQRKKKKNRLSIQIIFNVKREKKRQLFNIYFPF